MHTQPHNQTRELKKARAQRIKLFYRWHRRIGVSAAIFLIWIVISGWLLNHSDSLGLGRIELRNLSLANWYGLKVDLPTTMFTTEFHTLIGNKDNFLFDNRALGIPQIDVIGVVQTTGLVAVASENFLAIFEHNGHIVDTLNASDLPFPVIKKIGNGCNGIVLQGETETLASPDGIDWSPCTENIQWSTPTPIDQTKLDKIKNQLAPNISLEKLIIDLHTGRFFGRFGPYVVDAVGAGLLLLALSGLWMFFNVGAKQKSKQE